MLQMYKRKIKRDDICKSISNFLFSVRSSIHPCIKGAIVTNTSRQGNYFGIAGMIIAIVVTFLSIGNFSTSLIYVLIFLIIGGTIGAFIAFRIPMTAMPELVAGFHSLVGLAAVLLIAAFLNPEAFNLGVVGDIKLASLIGSLQLWEHYFFRVHSSFFKLRGIMLVLQLHLAGSTFKFITRYWYFALIFSYVKHSLQIFFGLLLRFLF